MEISIKVELSELSSRDKASIIKKRADEIRVGEIVHGKRVESVEVSGPMHGEETGYARTIEICYAASKGWMIPGSVGIYRGDVLLNVWRIITEQTNKAWEGKQS